RYRRGRPAYGPTSALRKTGSLSAHGLVAARQMVWQVPDPLRTSGLLQRPSCVPVHERLLREGVAEQVREATRLIPTAAPTTSTHAAPRARAPEYGFRAARPFRSRWWRTRRSPTIQRASPCPPSPGGIWRDRLG